MKNLIIILLLSLLISSFSSSQKTHLAVINFKIGDINVIRAGEKEKEAVSYSTKFYAGDLVETAAESRVEIRSIDESIFHVGESSLFQIRDIVKKEKETRSKFSLLFGKLYVKVKRLFTATDEHSIRLPTAVAAIRGTEFLVQVDSAKSQIFVNDGTVDVGTVEMLTDFDSFINFVQKDAELFEKWKNKNNGEEFIKNDLKAFKNFQKAEMDAYAAFVAGEKKTTEKSDSLWIKSVTKGKSIVIEGASRRVRPASAEDSLAISKYKSN
jgi:hypothetical protein